MNILITNMHSALNLGDEAIFYVTLLEIRRKYPDAKITIATNDPISWQKYSEHVLILPSMVTWVKHWEGGKWKLNFKRVILYLFLLFLAIVAYRFGIKVNFGSRDIKQLLSAYYTCDLLLVCGGGNIYSTKKYSWGLIWELLMFGFGGLIGKPVYLLPQSIGPIHGSLQKQILKFFLNNVQKIYVRDMKSADLLHELKIKKEYYIMPDLAFSLGNCITSKKIHDRLKIGFTVINLKSSLVPTVDQIAYELAIEELIKEFNKKYNASIKIIVQCYGPTDDQDDRIVSRKIYNKLKDEIYQLEIIDDLISGNDIHTIISDLDIMIGTRMHSGIFALCSCVPTILFKYQPKSYALMQMFGLEKYCIDLENLDTNHVYQIVNELINDKVRLKNKLEHEMSKVLKIQDEWLINLIN